MKKLLFVAFLTLVAISTGSQVMASCGAAPCAMAPAPCAVSCPCPMECPEPACPSCPAAPGLFDGGACCG